MQFIGILRHGWNQNRKSETRSQEYYIGFLERSALGDSENEKHIDFITRWNWEEQKKVFWDS